MFHIIEKGTEFADIPDVKIIYISTYDALNNGQTVTRVRRYQEAGDKILPVDDGEAIYFANTVVKDGSRKAALLQMFLETQEPETTDFPAVKNRIHYYKQTDEGRKEMSDAVLEYANERALESSVIACIMYCKRDNKSQEEAIKDIKSLNGDASIQTITELVYKNW